jgi:hypothetical protein
MPLAEEIIISSLCSLGALVEGYLVIYMRVYLRALCSKLSLFIFMSILYCFDYCSFVICFKIRKCEASVCFSFSSSLYLFVVL